MMDASTVDMPPLPPLPRLLPLPRFLPVPLPPPPLPPIPAPRTPSSQRRSSGERPTSRLHSTGDKDGFHGRKTKIETKAVHVTSLTKCLRLYGVNKKTIILVGTVLEVKIGPKATALVRRRTVVVTKLDPGGG